MVWYLFPFSIDLVNVYDFCVKYLLVECVVFLPINLQGSRCMIKNMAYIITK